MLQVRYLWNVSHHTMLTSANAPPYICLNVSSTEPLCSLNKPGDLGGRNLLAFGILSTLPFRRLFLFTARFSIVKATL